MDARADLGTQTQGCHGFYYSADVMRRAAEHGHIDAKGTVTGLMFAIPGMCGTTSGA